jgi:hypothetical protein
MDYSHTSRLIDKLSSGIEGYIETAMQLQQEESDCKYELSNALSCLKDLVSVAEELNDNLIRTEEELNIAEDKHQQYIYTNMITYWTTESVHVFIPEDKLDIILKDFKMSGLAYCGFSETKKQYMFEVLDVKLWAVFKIKHGF